MPKFYRMGAFYMVFSGYFLLEWFGRRIYFVKCVYRFNKSLTGDFGDKNNSYAPAQAIRLNRMGAMIRTFSLSQMNNVELARTLCHGEKTHFSSNEKRTILSPY